MYKGQKYISIESEKCSLESGGKKILDESSFQQFVHLRELKNEFTTEFRTYVILELVKTCRSFGISSGSIARFLQLEYGIRGNKRNTIKNSLDNMVNVGLLRLSGGTQKREGHVYFLGKTAESLFSSPGKS